MAEEAGEVEISHSVSIRFDNGKPVQIPSALLVEENVAKAPKHVVFRPILLKNL